MAGSGTPLRTLSSRPTLLADNRAHIVGDQGTRVGIPGALGRNRVVAALPMNKSTVVILTRPRVLSGHFLVGDADGNVIGTSNSIVVHRMLYATRTIDTRRL